MRRWWICIVALVCVCACACACQPIDRSGRPPEPVAVARDLVSRHAEVDRLIDAKDPQAARIVLEEMFAAPELKRMSADHRRAVEQDLCARLAEVELAIGEPGRALAAAERGLAMGSGEDVFTANLHIGAGRALEALSRAGEAADHYHRALQINETLLEKELAE